MKDDILSLSEDDYKLPDCSDNPELQEKWDMLDKAIITYHLYRGAAVKAGKTFGPGPVVNLIRSIVEANIARKKEGGKEVSVSGKFRQRIRQWKTTETDAAKEAMDVEYMEEVQKGHEAGFNPTKVSLWNGAISESDDAVVLARTLKFLTSLSFKEGEEPDSFEQILEDNKSLLTIPDSLHV